MKTFVFFSLFLLVLTTDSFGQIIFKTEYFGQSSYRDDNNNKVGNSKGSAFVYQGLANIPVSVKIDDNNKPTIWGFGLNGAYASLKNKDFTEDLVLSKILNLNLSLYHMRPLNDRWSLMASVGFGVYAPDSRLSKIGFKHVLGNAGVIFIRQLNPNLEIGGGLALNNTFGYPMVFPAFYFNWRYNKQYNVKISAMDGFEMSIGYSPKDFLELSLVAEVNGQMALLERNNKDVMFTHQYIVAGIRPEFKISKSFSIPLTVGINAMRAGYFNNRSIKALFNSGEYDPYFQISPYASAAIKIAF